MTRPKHYPRARWYAVRRNRRGEPTTVASLDELLAPLVRKATRLAEQVNPLLRMLGVRPPPRNLGVLNGTERDRYDAMITAACAIRDELTLAMQELDGGPR